MASSRSKMMRKGKGKGKVGKALRGLTGMGAASSAPRKRRRGRRIGRSRGVSRAKAESMAREARQEALFLAMALR